MEIRNWRITEGFDTYLSYHLTADVREGLTDTWERRAYTMTRGQILTVGVGGPPPPRWVLAVLKQQLAEAHPVGQGPDPPHTLPPSDLGLDGVHPLEEMEWPAPVEELSWLEQNRRINALIAGRPSRETFAEGFDENFLGLGKHDA